jgi:hypothetical protein
LVAPFVSRRIADVLPVSESRDRTCSRDRGVSTGGDLPRRFDLEVVLHLLAEIALAHMGE